jgi:hypothetical protein
LSALRFDQVIKSNRDKEEIQKSTEAYLNFVYNLELKLFAEKRLCLLHYYLDHVLEPIMQLKGLYLVPTLTRNLPIQLKDCVVVYLLQYQSILRGFVDISKGIGSLEGDRDRSKKLIKSFDWLYCLFSFKNGQEYLSDSIQRHVDLIEVSLHLKYRPFIKEVSIYFFR